MGRDGTFTKLSREEAMKSIKRDISDRKRSIKQWGNEGEQPNASGKKQARKDSVTGPNETSGKGAKGPGASLQSQKDVILSFRDARYKNAMHKSFREMETSNETALEVGTTMFKGFCAQLDKTGGSFFKMEQGGENHGGLVPISREVAKKRIVKHVHRRTKNPDAWREGAEGATGKRKPGDSLAAAPKKKQKPSENARDASTKRKKRCPNANVVDAVGPKTAPPRKSVAEENPLSYVGNYIANLLVDNEKWEDKLKKVDSINFGQVVYRKGCDKKTAEEGVDKFTGYAALARWANTPASGNYYTKHVVNTEEGRRILVKAGIASDPYSMFRSDGVRSGEEGRGRNKERGVGSGQAAPASNQRTAGRSSNQSAAKSSNPGVLPDSDDRSQGSNLIKDDETPKKKGSPFIGGDTEDFLKFHDDIESRRDAAEAQNDLDGVAFYSHLVKYCAAQASKQIFSLGSDKDGVNEAVKRFEDAKEKAKKSEMYKHFVTYVIGQCKEQFPVA